MKTNDYWMKIAFEEAQKGLNANEIPVGAIIVKNNKLISSSYNTSILKSDPTSHAEINVIRQAAKTLQNYRLSGVSLFVTLEPCAMCYGAIIHSRIEKLVFGAFDNKTGVCGSCSNFSELDCFNHYPKITGGVMEAECSKILKDFFKA